MEEFLLKPYSRLWSWAKARGTPAGRAGGFILFSLAILITIPILIIIGALMALGSLFAVIMG